GGDPLRGRTVGIGVRDRGGGVGDRERAGQPLDGGRIRELERSENEALRLQSGLATGNQRLLCQETPPWKKLQPRRQTLAGGFKNRQPRPRTSPGSGARGARRIGKSWRSRRPRFSLAAQAKGVALCFLKGAVLPDPNGLLRGGGRL